MPKHIERAFRAQTAAFFKHFSIAPTAIDSLVNAYSEPWRVYHGLEHIAGMLHAGVCLPLQVEDRWELGLLIIYHDVWYKIGREYGENERRSADWAIDDLENYPGNRERLFALVRQGIEATITHTLEGVDQQFVNVVSYLLDLDLWGLGQPRARFQADTEKVWREFEPMYTRDQFDHGRSAWAASFLKRPYIYHSERYRTYEGAAIENLRALAGE